MKILIIDDNVDGANSLARLVEIIFKYEVKIAYDGFDGISLAEKFQPDIILMDIGMPGLSGYNVAISLRKWYFGPLIAITGMCTPEDIHQSKLSGFDEHVIKPVTLQTLTRLLTR